MELSTHDSHIPIPIPIPLNSRYGGHDHDHDHIIHHDPLAATRNHIIAATALINAGTSTQLPTSHMESTDLHLYQNNNNNNNNNHNHKHKKHVKYRECLKNHAASIGGNATDGCGEFMPSGEEGSMEALTCSACNCHRNFHRKEIDGEPYDWLHHHHHHPRLGRNAAFAYPTAGGAPGFISSRGGAGQVAPHHMIMSYNMVGVGHSDQTSDQEQDQEAGGPGRGRGYSGQKKRFRTKFSAEQKEKMLRFAEKAGWKIQKQEESVVQQFCEDIGVKRRVLKVWMHNNKHNLANKEPIISPSHSPTPTPTPTPTPLN